MKRHRDHDADHDLNLAPIMNIVVILIPMLLLGVVFLSTAVINVSMPDLSPGPASEEGDEENPRVTLALGQAGVVISSKDGELARLELDDRRDYEETLRALEQAREVGDRSAEDVALTKLTEQFAWSEVYGAMLETKRQYPSTSTVHLSADPDLPYAILVAAMDAVRFELPSATYESDRDFWAANASANRDRGADPLFADPIVTVTR